MAVASTLRAPFLPRWHLYRRRRAPLARWAPNLL